jgi:hypothetical protein
MAASRAMLTVALGLFAVPGNRVTVAARVVDPPAVERLADHGLLTREVPLRGYWQMSPADIAALPSMKTTQLLGHFLSNIRVPGGVPLAGDELRVTRHQIEDELCRLLSSDIATPRAFEWLEIRRVRPVEYLIPPGSENPGLRKYAEERPPEILYFWPLKLEGKYRLQILGQPGEFVSIFIGCERRPASVWALALRVAPFLAGQTSSEVNVEHEDYTLLRKNDVLRVICGERSYGTRRVKEDGEEKIEVDPRRFFGISIDVDLKKMCSGSSGSVSEAPLGGQAGPESPGP